MEDELSMPRVKPGRRSLAFAYGLKRLARRVFGKERLLRYCLDASWMTRRFAHELGGELFGPSFYSLTMGLSDELLRTWIPVGGAVLDAGCGTGRWCRAAAPYAGRVVGIDGSAASIEQARALGRPENVEYRVGDVTQLDPGERFDVALLVHVLEHIDDAEALLSALGTVAPTLIVEVPDFGADGLNTVRRTLGCRWYSDEDHVREYTAEFLTRQLERAGWSALSVEHRHGMLVAIATRAGTGHAP